MTIPTESSVKAWCLTNILLRWIFQSALYWCDAKPGCCWWRGGQVGHWYQEQQRCQWQQGGTGRWPRAATLACQGYHWQDQVRCVKNINFPSIFPGLLDEGPQTKKMGFRRKQSWKSHCLLWKLFKGIKEIPRSRLFRYQRNPPLPCPRNSWKVHISWESNQMSTFDNCLFWIIWKPCWSDSQLNKLIILSLAVVNRAVHRLMISRWKKKPDLFCRFDNRAFCWQLSKKSGFKSCHTSSSRWTRLAQNLTKWESGGGGVMSDGWALGQ